MLRVLGFGFLYESIDSVVRVSAVADANSGPQERTVAATELIRHLRIDPTPCAKVERSL